MFCKSFSEIFRLGILQYLWIVVSLHHYFLIFRDQEEKQEALDPVEKLVYP